MTRRRVEACGGSNGFDGDKRSHKHVKLKSPDGSRVVWKDPNHNRERRSIIRLQKQGWTIVPR